MKRWDEVDFAVARRLSCLDFVLALSDHVIICIHYLYRGLKGILPWDIYAAVEDVLLMTLDKHIFLGSLNLTNANTI